jgi:hypothetical protein
MTDSRTFVSSSLTAGEVSEGILNRVLVNGAPFGLLHPAPPSAKLQHNRQEVAQIQGSDTPFSLLHPVPPSVKLQHNRREATQIQGNNAPFGHLHLSPPSVKL